MSTQSFYQGSPRPTRIPAIAVVHPGLQVHSIAAPKTDRRLSFLMSATLYCAFAAGAVVVAQATPAIHIPGIKSGPLDVLVELRQPEATPRPVAAIAPTPLNNLRPLAAVAPSIPEPQEVVDTNILPTTFGNTDLSPQSSLNAPSTPGTSGNPGGFIVKGTGELPYGPPRNQPMEVSASAVSILHQIRPVYPSLARVAHKEGDVVLIMTINEQGIPTDVKVDSGDAIFRGDAVRAAQQWRFTPARFDGQPHSARFRLTLQFRLRG